MEQLHSNRAIQAFQAINEPRPMRPPSSNSHVSVLKDTCTYFLCCTLCGVLTVSYQLEIITFYYITSFFTASCSSEYLILVLFQHAIV